MPTLSDFEDEDDIVAEYEKRDLDTDEVNINRDDRPGSENEEDEEASSARRIDPSTSKKHIVRNPLPKLNTERLKGPKGIQTIEKYFEGFKFHGKGYEKLDLDKIMKRMEHWAHRLFPKLEFDDFLERLEKLGSKKDLQVFVKKYRQDMISADEDAMIQNNTDEENDKEQDGPMNEFDLLIAEQIEKQKQVVNQQPSTSSVSTADVLFDKLFTETNNKNSQAVKENSAPSQLSDEIKQRIEKNKQQAIQRRLARLKAMQDEAKRQKLEEVKNTQLEEVKDTQLEEVKDTQLEDSSCKTQICSETPNLESKNFEDNTQEVDKDHES